jgi:hypothetical protein
MHGVEGVKGEYNRHLLLCAKIIQNFRIFFHAIFGENAKTKIPLQPYFVRCFSRDPCFITLGKEKEFIEYKIQQ